jgi:ankyrin repeat protein
MAAANGRQEVAGHLLARGADVNARSDDGDCPLHEAAARGHLEMVRLLLDGGADVNVRSTSRSPVQARAGNTPLHDAVAKGREDVVGLLLVRGADVGARSGRGLTPLHLAAGPGHTGIVRKLLEGGADVGAFGDDGLTPLHAIAAGGEVPSAELLLGRGADVNVRSKPSALVPITASLKPNPWAAGGNTPLHLAVLAERSGMVKLLLRRKADPEARNDLGRKPFDYARTAEMKDLLRQVSRD